VAVDGVGLDWTFPENDTEHELSDEVRPAFFFIKRLSILQDAPEIVLPILSERGPRAKSEWLVAVL
jgi:hypothetical protein